MNIPEGEPWAEPTQEREFSLRTYLLVLLKRRTLIVSTVLLFGIAAAVFSFLQTPQYLSTVVLYIDRSFTFNILPQVVSEPPGGQRNDVFLQNQFTLLKSKTLAGIVVKKLNLAPEDFMSQKEKARLKGKAIPQAPEMAQERIAEHLTDIVQIVPIRDTSFCQISFLAPSPDLSMTLANTWAEEYMKYSLTAQHDIKENIRKLMSDQVKDLQTDIQKKEKALGELSLQRQVINIDQDHPIDVRTIEDLNGALTVAKQDRVSKKVHYEDLLTHGSDYGSMPEITTSEVITQLKGEYSTLAREYAEKSRLYQPDYPEMVRLNSQMTEVQERIKQESSDIYNQVVAAARTSYQEAEKKEIGLKDQIEQSKQDSVDGRRQALTYNQLATELDKKKKVLDALLTKQNETDVTADLDQKATTIRIVQRAELPRSIYSPKTLMNVLIALLIGLAVGLLLSFVLEFLDSSLKSTDDVKDHLHLPIMGVVPKYRIGEIERGVRFLPNFMHRKNGNSSAAKNADLVSVQNPGSIASEALRAVRTSLLLSSLNSSPRVIMITSSRTGEGKTFVSCNLAVSLTQLHKRVVLIDADMRNPRQHRVWNVRNNPGLGRYLNHEAQYSDIVKASGVENLSLVPSGSQVLRPAELISSPRFEELLEQLSADFDHVIVDTPPLLPVSDSQILAEKCGNVLLVVHGGETPRNLIEIAIDKLQQTEAVILGVVLNGIDLSDPYYYYSHYANKAYGDSTSAHGV